MKKTFIISTLVVTVLVGCAPTIQLSATSVALSETIDRQARSLASYDLFDPGSAQYRNLNAYQLSNGDIAICGEQNGRNRLGGFVGFQPFYLRFTPGASPTRRSLHREILAQSACNSLGTGRGIPVAAE